MSPRQRLPRLARHAMALACVAPMLALSLTVAPAEAAGQTLHRGSVGPRVRLLESRLHRLQLLPRSAVDRRYRAATVRSVKRFQRQRQLRVTGRVNVPTWNLVAQAVADLAGPPPPAPAIIGHRGVVNSSVPENTLASLRRAAPSAAILEFDVRLTADHELVLMHDETLNRTTNCSGLVSSWALADLQAQCRAGDQPVPTLAEATAYAETLTSGIAPELKDADISDEDIGKALTLIEDHGLADRVVVQSFNPGTLVRVHAQRPGLRTAYVSPQPPTMSAIRATEATTVAVRQDNLTAARVALYKEAGLRVWTYTALTQAHLAAARGKRVDAVVTNVPGVAASYYG